MPDRRDRRPDSDPATPSPEFAPSPASPVAHQEMEDVELCQEEVARLLLELDAEGSGGYEDREQSVVALRSSDPDAILAAVQALVDAGLRPHVLGTRDIGARDARAQETGSQEEEGVEVVIQELDGGERVPGARREDGAQASGFEARLSIDTMSLVAHARSELRGRPQLVHDAEAVGLRKIELGDLRRKLVLD